MFPTPYQIKEEDEDLLTTANNLGVPYDLLTQANPNIQSVSQGQFINVPNLLTGNIPTNVPSSAGGLMAVSGSNAPYRGQPEAVSLYGSSIGGVGAIGNMGQNIPLPTSPGTPNTPQIGFTPPNPGAIPAPTPQQIKDTPVAGRLLALAEQEQLNKLQTSLVNATSPDQLPPNVPAIDAFKLGYTPEDMKQAGYVFYRGTYKKAEVASVNATPSVVTAGTPQSTRTTDEFGNAWNPATAQTDVYGGRFVQEGAKRWRRTSGGRFVQEGASGGRWRKTGSASSRGGQTTPQPIIRSDTPSTTLDLVLGT